MFVRLNAMGVIDRGLKLGVQNQSGCSRSTGVVMEGHR